MVLGSVPAGNAILRVGARPADFLYVTGTLGAAVAALNQLRDGEKLRPRSYPKHFYPEPRVEVGQFLREKKLASAMIDISDGLSTDLGHICEESGTGAVVYAEALPATGGKDGLTLALHGGDEYELLFTAHPERRIPKQIAGVPITRIGEILSRKQMRLATADGKTRPLKPAGWEHFG
jgi:thiamine-monophosphate kinase